MRRPTLLIPVLTAAVLFIAACGPTRVTETNEPEIANPAAAYCVEQGGRSELRTQEGGAVAGSCVFTDGSQCEEWAFFRGECKPGYGGADEPAATEVSLQETFSDPFQYCAAVRQIDSPDERYTGPKMSQALFNQYMKAAGLDPSLDYPDTFKEMTIWRCMEGKVYACNFGANIPCDSKANTDQTPTQAMIDYCKQFPDNEFIPMSVTGHNVIYSWHCVKETPEILEQIDTVDAAGYQSSFWKQVEPAP